MPSSAPAWFGARASADRPKDAVERLALRAEVMTQRGAALKKLADAAGPLYKSLDEAQQRRFVVLARFGAHRFAGGRGWHNRGGWMHRGPGGSENAPMRPEGGPRPQ